MNISGCCWNAAPQGNGRKEGPIIAQILHREPSASQDGTNVQTTLEVTVSCPRL